MDINGYPQTDLDFLSLPKALQNTTQDGCVVSPISLDWDSQYSDDSQFINTISQDSFSSSTTAINTTGTNTPENFCVWDSTLNRENTESLACYQAGDSQRQWIHQMNLWALPENLETYLAHSPRHASLIERTPRSLSSLAFHNSSSDLSHGQQLEPSKSSHLASDNIASSNETISPAQSITLSVASSCKRKPTSTPSTKLDDHRPVKKTAHNMIEKRYRNKLNDSIAELRDTIPSLKLGGSGMGKEGDPLPKLYKATVITKAVEHISALEKEISRLMEEVENLGSQIENIKAHSTNGQDTKLS